MSQQVGIAYELYAIAAAVLGGCSLRGGEGTVLGIVIGSAIMRVIDNGINMFQFQYTDDARRRADLAPRPELDVRHRRRRDPARRGPRPGRAHRAVGAADARGGCGGRARRTMLRGLFHELCREYLHKASLGRGPLGSAAVR